MNGGISMRQTRGVASRQKNIMRVVSSDTKAAVQYNGLKSWKGIKQRNIKGGRRGIAITECFGDFARSLQWSSAYRGVRQTFHVSAELGVTCGDDAVVLRLLVPILEASSNGMLTRDIGSGFVKH